MGAGAQQAFLVPYLGRVNGWSSLHASYLIGATYFAMMVGRVAHIYLLPGWSDRRLIIVGSLTYLIFTLAIFTVAHVDSYLVALSSALLWGMGGAMMWAGTAMQTLVIADEAKGRQYGTSMGILYAAANAGWLAGVIVLGNLYERLPPSDLPLLYLAASGLTLLGVVQAMRLPATTRSGAAPSEARVLAIAVQPRLLVPGLLLLAASLSFGLILGAFGTFVNEVYGARWVWVSVSLYPAVRTVLSFVGGYLMDRAGQVPVLVGSFLGGAAGLLVTVLWSHPLGVVFGATMLGLVSSTVPVVTGAMIGSTDIRQRPLEFGIVFTWRDLGVIIAAVGANAIGLTFDLHAAFLFFACVFLLCGLLSLYLRKTLTERG
jgi:MFS family permease